MRHALDAFGRWFCSDWGTLQTLGGCVAIVGAELAWPALDPHGFWLLYWLTIYSAVTQPALARAGRVQAEQGRRHEDQLMALVQKIARMEAAELLLRKEQ